MNVGSLIEYLEAYNDDDEVAVAVKFPQPDGWEVVSFDLVFSEREGFPAIELSVYGADFDYPGLARALERITGSVFGYPRLDDDDQNW